MTSPDVQIDPDGLVLVNGKEPIELGQNRRVSYGTGDFIIKVDRYPEYHESEARKEITLWADLDEEDRKHFVPILCGSVDEGWICQEYLEIIHPTKLGDEVRMELWLQIVKPLCKKYNLYDINSSWNWGMVDGVPMIYDYGE